jgi:F0F1-type ATP synthase membrane subunit c/vacuolar-type H+-ATPase subunit K
MSKPGDANEDNRKQGKSKLATWSGVGVAIGVALGAALGNIGIGIAIGVAIGAAIGSARDRKRP